MNLLDIVAWGLVGVTGAFFLLLLIFLASRNWRATAGVVAFLAFMAGLMWSIDRVFSVPK